MQTTELAINKGKAALENAKTLLIVGPLPPPIGGSPLTVQAMIGELDRYPTVRVKLINTSPVRDVRKKADGFNFEKIRRMIYILTRYILEIRSCNAVLVFANDLFAFILVPILLQLARVFHKPFYLKPVGSGLDLFITAQKKLIREFILYILRSMDGILAQTQILQAALEKLGCTNTYYLPGCRPLTRVSRSQKRNPEELRLIFLAHITRNKGPLVLLQALQLVAQNNSTKVSCDFYGPIHDDVRDEFNRLIEKTPNVRYCGVAAAGTGSQLIAEYDALVLPTHYNTEGHPGVLIEAMHAGVPVISTQMRTIFELVTDGENGILVPVLDSNALAEAIMRLSQDPALRERMGQANYRKGHEFRSDVVVDQMLKIIFPDGKLKPVSLPV